MAPKMRHVLIKIKDLDVRAANVLKQEMLAKGAEAAVAKWASGFSRPTTDVLLMGTVKQYRLMLKKLPVQPFGLRNLVGPIDRAIKALEPERSVVKCKNFDLNFGRRTLIMGILNVTPDSFSEDGLFFDRDKAIDHALRLFAEGADIIDVGGESTRPGAAPVSTEEEKRRVIPVILELAKELTVPISIDTGKATVAEAAIDAGASIVNDVTALRGEKDMAEVCAAGGVGVVLMHMRGEPATMQNKPTYADLMGEIILFLRERIEAAVEAGIDIGKIFVDPGIGFGKTVDHNLDILRRLEEMKSLGRPVLVGTSRKSTIGKVLGDLDVSERLEGTAATVAIAVANGADMVRVHDVKAMFRAARLADAVYR